MKEKISRFTKKLISLAALFVLTAMATPLFAQALTEEEIAIINAKIIAREKAERESYLRSNFFLSAGGAAYLSDSTYGDSSPQIKFLPGIGFNIPIGKAFALQPHITGFHQYYQWNENTKNAYPAAPENRTASAVTFVTDIPFLVTLKGEKFSFNLGGGFGFLLRIPSLAYGVKESDEGTSGNAKQDFDKISKWFWNPLHFVYPEGVAEADFTLENGRIMGIVLRAYIPISIVTQGLNNTIFSVSVRFTLPQNPKTLALLQEEIPELPPETTEEEAEAEATETETAETPAE